MVKILISILFNAAILFIVAYFLNGNDAGLSDGIIVSGGLSTYLVGGVILGLINLTIKPVLHILSLPLFFVFFGLVSIVINAILLFLLDYILNVVLQIPELSYKIAGIPFSLDWWVNFIIAVAIFSVLNMIYALIFKR